MRVRKHTHADHATYAAFHDGWLASWKVVGFPRRVGRGGVLERSLSCTFG